MTFNKCIIHMYYQNQDIGHFHHSPPKVTIYLFQSILPILASGNQGLISHSKIALPFLQCHINKIMMYEIFCIYLLESIIFLKFFYVVSTSIADSSFLAVNLYVIEWIYHNLVSIFLWLDILVAFSFWKLKIKLLKNV